MADEASSPLHRIATRIEEEAALDAPVRALDRVLPGALRVGPTRALLGGRWLGHALHPMLTDFPLGAWASASLLDLIGGRSSRTASRRLIGFGVLAAVPTAVTGASDWTATDRRERRVGVVHAASNTVGLSCYAASWLARRRGHHWRGVAFGLAGGAAATVGGFLGGHLSLATDAGRRATESALDGGTAAAPDATIPGRSPGSPTSNGGREASGATAPPGRSPQ